MPEMPEPEQRARVAALHNARAVLESRGARGPFVTVPASDPPLIDDLITVANYIVTGQME